jgi:hypothetical protein
VNLEMEPAGKGTGWRVNFALDGERPPDSIELPGMIAGRRFEGAEGCKYREQNGRVMIDPASRKWIVYWR